MDAFMENLALVLEKVEWVFVKHNVKIRRLLTF